MPFNWDAASASRLLPDEKATTISVAAGSYRDAIVLSFSATSMCRAGVADPTATTRLQWLARAAWMAGIPPPLVPSATTSL